MTADTDIEELWNGLRVRGPLAQAFLECVRSAARKLDVQLVERDGCVVFDNDELALRVLQKAIHLAGERAK